MPRVVSYNTLATLAKKKKLQFYVVSFFYSSIVLMIWLGIYPDINSLILFFIKP